MKPARSAAYLAWIRTQPCLICGRTRWIEAAHTGLRGPAQKSSDYSAIPLCAAHHRTGRDSYHRLGAPVCANAQPGYPGNRPEAQHEADGADRRWYVRRAPGWAAVQAREDLERN